MTTPALALRARIESDPAAVQRLLRYAAACGIGHRNQVTQQLLADVCRSDLRTWQRWEAGDRAFPELAGALLELICWPPKIIENIS